MSSWNLEEILRRLEAIKGFGSLEEMLGQAPWGAFLKDLEFDLSEFDLVERILRAMTLEERLQPDLLEGDDGYERRQRIAADAKTTLDTVNNLLGQFKDIIEQLEEKSPEEVVRDIVESMQPKLEAWQTSPDSWKAEPDVVFVHGEDDEEAEEEDDVTEQTQPKQANFDATLDDVLRKISHSGMDSLSPGERAFLDEASRTLRNADA